MASLAIITALPDFISPEEHRNVVASTPSSFGEIHPVLRHKQEDVSISLDPPLHGLSPEDTAHGVLYIIESALVFMSSTGRGLQVTYPAITLHAISRADGNTPSMYCQLDKTNGSPPPDETAEDVTDTQELVIVPRDPDSLESIFEAMSLCASLHPDPDMLEEDEFDGDIEEGEDELSEVGRAALAHLESIIYDPEAEVNGKLDDAEEVSSDQGDTES